MNLVFGSDFSTDPVLDCLFARWGSVDRRIHPDDEMWQWALKDAGGLHYPAILNYFLEGRSIAEPWMQILEQCPKGRDARILDFASGWGRVTRHLVRDIPPSRLWVSDILTDAVTFQRRNFGVRGFPSTPNPGDLEVSGKFDAIFVASLFTHLPEPSFHAWLARLWTLVETGGILAFTVHDGAHLDEDRSLPESGIRFESHSESRVLPGEDYGSAWVSEDFVNTSIASLEGGAKVKRFPRLLFDQDLWILSRGRDITDLCLPFPHRGALEGFDLVPKTAQLRGWALDVESSQPMAKVILRTVGRDLEGTLERAARPDVGVALGLEGRLKIGFTLLFEGVMLTRSPLNQVVEIVFVDSAGVEHAHWIGTVEGLLRHVAEQENLRLAERQRHWKHRFVEVEEALNEKGWEAERRQRVIEAMEQSRFWKLREIWFWLKKKLGKGA